MELWNIYIRRLEGYIQIAQWNPINTVTDRSK